MTMQCVWDVPEHTRIGFQKRRKLLELLLLWVELSLRLGSKPAATNHLQLHICLADQ